MDCLPYITTLLLKNVPGYKKREKKSKCKKSVKGYDEPPILVPGGTLVMTLSQTDSIKTYGAFDPLHNYRCIDSCITHYTVH